VGSLATGSGWGIGLGKATTKDAKAPSKKIKYTLDTIFDFGFLEMFSVLPSRLRYNRKYPRIDVR
jgi:hypothetical protein